MKNKQLQHIILMVEALLIILTLATGGKAVIGMICYWSIVAVNHLTDFLIGRREDGSK